MGEALLWSAECGQPRQPFRQGRAHGQGCFGPGQDPVDLVYDEFKVRVLVEGFSCLSPEQREHLFDRLQIPTVVRDKLFIS